MLREWNWYCHGLTFKRYQETYQMSSKGGPGRSLECCQVASVYFVASIFHIQRLCVCRNADVD